MDIIKLTMNYEARFKEIGCACALSLLIATPARSKVLPFSTQLTALNMQSQTQENSITNKDLDDQIYNINFNVDNISILLDNLSEKGDKQQFPIFTNQISSLTPILKHKVLEKQHQKKFTGKFTDAFVSHTESKNPKINTLLELSELTTNLQSENGQALPTSSNSLTLLPPISEKRTLITRNELLKKKIRIERLQSQAIESRYRKEQDLDESIVAQTINKKLQQNQKNFQDIEPLIPEYAEENQLEKKLTNFNLSTLQNESNAREENVVEQQNQIEQKLNRQATKIFRINEIQQPLTIASGLYQPELVITNFAENTRIAQQIIQVTNIRVNTTEEGVEIVLETLNGEQLQLRSSVDGNALIADIPNAILALPDTEEFLAKNPIRGIANITAKTIDANSIRVTIEGETDLPRAAILSTNEGLILSVIPVTDEEIEVVISAARTGRKEEDIPRSITVIDREQIESQGAVSSTNNVSDILGRLVPGYGPPNKVERRTRAQTMRGRPALILIDGVVQNTNYNLGSELNTIDPSAIERIEVIRGPSALYGSGGSGGIINIITREPTELNLQQEVQVSINDSIGDETFPGNGIGYNSRYSLSGNQGIFDWRIQGSLNQNNRLYDADGNIIPSDDLDGSRSINVLTKLGVDIGENQKLALSYNLYNDRIFSEYLADPITLSIPGLQRARALRRGKLEYEEPPEQTNHNVSLTYNHDDIFFGSKLYTQFFFQHTDRTNKVNDTRPLISVLVPNVTFPPDSPFVIQNGLDLRKLGTRFQINTPITNSANLLWGFDYTNERNDSEVFFNDSIAFDEEREVNIIGSGNNNVPQFKLDNIGLFLEGNWDVSQKLILSGGLRYENIDIDVESWTAAPLDDIGAFLSGEGLTEFEGGQSNESDVAFNFGILYKLSSTISLYANFSQGFTIPSLTLVGLAASQDFDVFEIEDLLTPEKVDNYEVGVRGNWNSIQFTAAAYYNNTDLGQNFTLVPGSEFTDIVRAPQRNYGLEASIDWQPANTWNLGGTFTWMEGDGDLFPNDNRSFVPLSSLDVQPMKFTFYLENQTLPSWRNRLQLLYVTDRDRAFDDGVDNVKISGYTTIDFVSILNTGLGRLEIGIENLLNHQYFPVVAQLRSTNVQEERRFAAPGRTLSIRYFFNF